ncbi:insulinase family protein [Pedobacter sp.]|uniref:insulinase family protein n=1 Tax=Pedobacter sp. TaxID=1411316 RepID=UPI003D7F5552
MPATHRKETWKDAGIRTPKGKIRKNVYKGSEDKATVQLVLSGDYKESKKEKLIVSALEEVLSFRMLDRLRKKESGIYSPGVSLSASMYPVPSYRVGVSFGCAPENVETLIKAAEEELHLLASKGALPSELDKFKAEAKLAHETALKTNVFWRNELVSSYRENKNPSKLLEFERSLASISISDLRKAAKRYFDLSNYMVFVLFPEEFKEKS